MGLDASLLQQVVARYSLRLYDLLTADVTLDTE